MIEPVMKLLRIIIKVSFRGSTDLCIFRSSRFLYIFLFIRLKNGFQAECTHLILHPRLHSIYHSLMFECLGSIQNVYWIHPFLYIQSGS
jgi:hypothetical protein